MRSLKILPSLANTTVDGLEQGGMVPLIYHWDTRSLNFQSISGESSKKGLRGYRNTTLRFRGTQAIPRHIALVLAKDLTTNISYLFS